jgi:hypothetical protein
VTSTKLGRIRPDMVQEIADLRVAEAADDVPAFDKMWRVF